jgi:brefeldin A-inhibited guanine nucleotide-exchange protein
VFTNVESNLDDEDTVLDDDDSTDTDLLTDVSDDQPTSSQSRLSINSPIAMMPRSGSSQFLTQEEVSPTAFKNRSMSLENLKAKEADLIDNFVGELLVEGALTSGVKLIRVDNPFRRDAIETMKELCGLSIKKLPTQSSSIENTIEMKTRLTALELIIRVMETAGPKFKSSKALFRFMRHSICKTLLVNALASQQQLFDQSIALFKIIIKSYKQHFRNEIVAFLTQVYLKLWNSPNSTFQQKLTIATMFQGLMSEPQFPVDMFANYDCSTTSSINGLEKIVEGISQAVRGVKSEANWITPQQEINLKLLGLQSIEKYLSTLIELHKKKLKENTRMSVESRELENQRRKKADFKEGLQIFNEKSAMKGIDFLVKTDHLKKDPIEVAKFIQSQAGLNRTHIGEFLGTNPKLNPFPALVMKEWLKYQDFTGLDLETGFRKFLTTIVLPKEGQVIDRIVDAWAAYWYEQNKNDTPFKNESVVHVFACFILLLNTQLHNPNLANNARMDVSEFIKNTVGINEGEDLSKDFLTKLYNNLKNNEIKPGASLEVTDDTSISEKLDSMPIQKRKQILYDRESSQIIRQTKATLADHKNGIDFVENVSGVHHIGSMWEVTWKSVLSCIDHLFDLVNDERQFIQLCVRSFEYAIIISGRYENDDARTEFSQCLAKYANLSFVPSELRVLPKNVECVKLLLRIADREGDYLKSTWEQVLTTLSQIDFLGEAVRGAKGEYAKQVTQLKEMQKIVEQVNNAQKEKPNILDAPQINVIKDINSMLKIGRDNQPILTGFQAPLDTEYLNVDKVLSMLDDKSGTSISTRYSGNIMLLTAELGDEALVELIKALCAVSLREELNAVPPIRLPAIAPSQSGVIGSNALQQQLQDLSAQYEPRLFLMNMLFNVSLANVNRKEKFVWAPMWLYMADYFVAVGSHKNVEVFSKGIGNLYSEMVQALLSHQEMLDSLPNFQAALIQPFLRIIQQNKSGDVRGVVIECVGKIVEIHYKAIENGWRTVLDILLFIANQTESDSRLLEASFKPLASIVAREDCFNKVCESKSFVELVNCFIAYAKNQQNAQLSALAVDNVAKCATQLGTGVLPGTRINKESVVKFTDAYADVNLWTPIVKGLCALISDDVRFDIRRHARTTLTAILKTHGSKFDPALWKIILDQYLSPLFNNILPADPKLPEPKKVEEVIAKPTSRWKGLANDAIAETKVEPVKKVEEEVKPAEIVVEKLVITTDSLWVRTSCEAILLDMVEIMDYFYSTIPFAFESVMKIIQSCFKQESVTKITLSSKLVKTAVSALTRVVELSANKLSDDHWTAITKLLHKLASDDMNATLGLDVPLPSSVKESESRLSYMNMQGSILQSLIQLEQFILTSQFSRVDTTMTVAHVRDMLHTLKFIYTSAKQLNEGDIMNPKKGSDNERTRSMLPAKMFLDHETAAVGGYLTTLFRMLNPDLITPSQLRQPCLELAERLAVPIINELVQRYLAKADIIKGTDEFKPVNMSEMIELIPIIVQALNGILEITDSQFVRYVEQLYLSFSDLVLSEHRVIRVALRNVFVRYKSLRNVK